MQMLRLLLDSPKGPTSLQQGLGLNYPKFVETAKLLESKELIRKDTEGEREVYRITPAGAQLHREWRSVVETLGDVS